MAFAAIRPGGATDVEFESYVRLLRQTGVDIGKAPRMPEPSTDRRWLHVWNTHADAQAFVDELRERMGEDGWEVVEVCPPPSEGPLGPITIQFVRQGDRLTFALPPLSCALIRSAFPQAVSSLTFAILDRSGWDAFRKKRGEMDELVRQIGPNLTGLTEEQLQDLGYAVVDVDTDVTLVSVPPTIPAPVSEGAIS